MSDQNLDWSFDMSGVDRAALLQDAAERFDKFAVTHLGERDTQVGESPEGTLARALLGDVAEFAASPVVYKITDQDFIGQKLNVPFKFKELSRDYNFYWFYFPIALHPGRDKAFNRLEVAVEFNPEEKAGHLRPKAYQILPDKKFETLLQARQQLELGLDENFEFGVKTGEISGKAGGAEGKVTAGVDVKAAAGAGFVAGPFVYTIRRAKIEHTSVGLEKVFWRLDSQEFFQGDDVPLVVVAQVPKETKSIRVAAAMQAYRHFNWLSASLQSVAGELPRALRDFFKGGAPLRDQANWDVTPML
ncbi:MAG TPA: hypothetical protein VF588_05695 [Pyrinomonadaceae bacterium]